MRGNIKTVIIFALLIACVLSFAGCKDDDGKDGAKATPTPTAGIGTSTVTLDDKVDERVSGSINFEEYENQNAYVLEEIEDKDDIKIIAPVHTYMSDKMKVEYHIECVKNDDGTKTLELFGTDFVISKDFSAVTVEWMSFGEVIENSEKLYRFVDLCILLDDEVYFYEEKFYSPIVDGRGVTVEYLD